MLLGGRVVRECAGVAWWTRFVTAVLTMAETRLGSARRLCAYPTQCAATEREASQKKQIPSNEAS